jgi:hypothetical protein
VSVHPRATRAGLVLGALFVGTAGAAVATQRIKDSPALVRRVHVTPVFTPNGDRWRDRATVRFILGRSGTVTVTVRDGAGRAVRRLAQDRRQPAGRFLRLRWDGRTDARRPAPAGTYRVGLRLVERGRSLTLQDAVTLRRRPPHGKGAPR